MPIDVWAAGVNISRLIFQLLFDDNRIKMARKPGKKKKENPVGCKKKIYKNENKVYKNENLREGKTGSVL